MILNQIKILLLIMIMIFEEKRRHKEINYIKNDKKVKEQTKTVSFVFYKVSNDILLFILFWMWLKSIIFQYNFYVL